MTSEADRARDSATPGLAAGPQPPLVTIVVVNYNFGRFLRETLASVFAQTYPRIECLVVDNASTDDSVAIVKELQATHPTLELLEREANDGQTAATMDGVARAQGAYVILVDADDLLLPHCVATHVQVHLASRVHVGFTSGDMLQMVGDQVVLSTGEAMAGFFSANPAKTDLLRTSAGALAPVGTELAPGLAERVYLVPRSQKKWVWSPTSGMCFRRDALALFSDNPTAMILRSQTDLYLALGINAVSGSILIDEPLFVYRLHGSNVFSSRAQMVGTLSFDPARTGSNKAIAHRLLIDHILAHIDRFVQEPWQAMGLLLILRRFNFRGGGEAGRWGSYLASVVPKHAAGLRNAVGKGGAFLFMLLAGVSWLTIWDFAARKTAP